MNGILALNNPEVGDSSLNKKTKAPTPKKNEKQTLTKKRL